MAISLSSSTVVVEASATSTCVIYADLAKGSTAGAVAMWSAEAEAGDGGSLICRVLTSGVMGASTSVTGASYFDHSLAFLNDIDTNLVGLTYTFAHDTQPSGVTFAPISISGTTVSRGTSACFSNVTLILHQGATQDGAKAVVRGAYLGGDLYYRFTIAGTTATQVTPLGGAGFIRSSTQGTQTMAALDNSKVLHGFGNPGSLVLEVMDLSTTITRGASSNTNFTLVGNAKAAYMENDKAVVAIATNMNPASASRAVALFVVNTTGTTISSIGASTNAYTTASNVGLGYLDISRRDNNSVVVFYEKSGSGILETFSVVGNTITSNNDAQVISGSFNSVHGVVATTDISGIATYKNSLGDLLYRSFSISGDANDLKILGVDSDDTYLYTTSYYGGNLQCRAYETENIVNTASFNTITQAGLASGCYLLEPTVDDEGNLFVWGRDGTASPLRKSVNHGETFSGWSASEWTSNDKIVAFMPGNFNDYIALFESGCVWRTVSGSGGWEKIDDGFTACAVKADRNRERPKRFLASACDAGDLQWTIDYGKSWTTSARIDTTGSTHRIRWVNER